MRILYLSCWYPFPPDNGSKLRIYNLLRGLAQKHEVTLLSFSEQPEKDRGDVELASFCSEVHIVPWKRFNPKSLRAYLGYFSKMPRSVVDTYSPEMAQLIHDTLRKGGHDLVIAAEVGTAVYSQNFSEKPALLEDVEIAVLHEKFFRASSTLNHLRYSLTWAKHQRYLAQMVTNFRGCTVVSTQEQALLKQIIPAYDSVEIIPNCISLNNYQNIRQIPDKGSLIFTGAFSYDPNYQAMEWFIKEVLPRIHAKVPEARLTITGDHGNRPLPPARNLTLTGYVDDIRELIASSWISLAPIWSGGGTRLKILEAMALRTPVVATSKGAEGLDVINDEHLLIADSAEDFAKSILRLLEEPQLRKRLADNAYQLVRDKYDWSVVLPRFIEVVERTAKVPTRR